MSKFEDIVARAPLVPLKDLNEFNPEFREWGEARVKKMGQLSSSIRAIAHADDLALKTRAFLAAAGAGGSLDPELTILIRLLVSNINTCLYCASHQLKRIADLGVQTEKVENIHDFITHPAFSDEERAALQFAAALTQDSANIPDDVCRQFTSAFNPQQRVEITLVAAAMGMLNRFNDGLRIPIDDDVIDLARSAAESFDK